MNKKTAIEWLVQEINKINVSIEARLFIDKLTEQAKAMEKEQHQQTATHFFPTSLKKDDFEQYYNETYGQNRD